MNLPDTLPPIELPSKDDPFLISFAAKLQMLYRSLVEEGYDEQKICVSLVSSSLSTLLFHYQMTPAQTTALCAHVVDQIQGRETEIRQAGDDLRGRLARPEP